MADLDDSDVERVADLLAAKLLGHRRAIKVDEQRPAGYTYVYLEHIIGTGLTGKEWDLAFTLASRADLHGLIIYSAGELCRTLDFEPSQLHKALRAIVAAGLMEKVARKSLRLNPRMMWHGSSATQVSLLADQIGAELKLRLVEGGLLPLPADGEPTGTSDGASLRRPPRARGEAPVGRSSEPPSTAARRRAGG
jgi:hypothetical protein